jgi:hypothetical protein
MDGGALGVGRPQNEVSWLLRLPPSLPGSEALGCLCTVTVVSRVRLVFTLRAWVPCELWVKQLLPWVRFLCRISLCLCFCLCLCLSLSRYLKRGHWRVPLWLMSVIPGPQGADIRKIRYKASTVHTLSQSLSWVWWHTSVTPAPREG